MAANKVEFTMSGTSQSAAVVSGVAALMLQYYPSLTPDMVKYRIMNSGNPRVKSDGTLAYSVFQQGAGVVDAYDAVIGSGSFGSANAGLDVAKDAAGTQHYGGPAQQYPNNGAYYISGMGAYDWNGTYSGRRRATSGQRVHLEQRLHVEQRRTSGATGTSGRTATSVLGATAYIWSNGLAEAASSNAWVNRSSDAGLRSGAGGAQPPPPVLLVVDREPGP